MVALCLLQILCTNFIQRWNLPQGIDWGASRLVIGDTDRDSSYEFIFSTYGGPFTIYLYELHLPDVWEVDSLPDLSQPLVWDIGDFDNDGFHDLIMQSSWGAPLIGIAIFESPDSFSWPIQEVWRDTVGAALVQPISGFDIDRDSLPELVNNNGSGQPHYVWIYEAMGDNQYDTVCTFNPMVDTFAYGIASNHAFGDFDGDTRVEFVAGELSGHFWVFESPSNNTYEQVHQGLLSTYNIIDCFSISDADGDGKLEFVVKGYVTAYVNAFIFEATGDNTYEIIKSFDLPGGHNNYYRGYSDAGDVDGDSIPEIALEACQNIYIIKAEGNDSFYVWETLPGNNSGSSVRVFDIDGNGFSEVIISGNNQTRIYEYQVGISELAIVDIQRIRFDPFPNPFRDRLNIVFQNQEGCEPEIEIYDVSGRVVRGYSQPISTQQYRISWDGKDNYGHQLPGGVYFVRLETADYIETKKVVLLD